MGRIVGLATKCISKTHGYESTLKGVDQSLERFGFGEFIPSRVGISFIQQILDYIDLFLIHDPFAGKERRLATYKALQESKEAGKIRDVGVSNL